MATNTTRLGLYKPGGGSTGLILPDEIADIDKINGNMDLIDAAIGAKNVTSTTRPAVPFDGQIIRESDTLNTLIYSSSVVRWIPIGVPNAASSAIRDALFPSPAAGNTVLRTDLGYPQRYNAAGVWRGWGSGLLPVKPLTVGGTGVTLGADGVVTFAAATVVNLNGCFTADFDNYLMIVETTARSASANVFFRARNAGVDDVATPNYAYVRGYDYTTTRSVATITGVAQIELDAGGTAKTVMKVDIYDPFKAALHTISSVASAYPFQVQTNGIHNSLTSLDGFSLLPTTGTMDGILRLYGYSNN